MVTRVECLRVWFFLEVVERNALVHGSQEERVTRENSGHITVDHEYQAHRDCWASYSEDL